MIPAGDIGVNTDLLRVVKSLEGGRLRGSALDTLERGARIMTDDCKTDPNYWDCECQHFFIHPKGMESCPICGAHQDDQPNSRVAEIELLYELDWRKSHDI